MVAATSKILPACLTALLLAPLLPGPVGATEPDADPGGVDAGDTFAAATPVDPIGLYEGELWGADRDDYYQFYVAAGEPINIEIRDVLIGGSLVSPDIGTRFSFRLLSPQGVLLDTPNTNQGDTRVMVAAAPGPGWYRFHVTQDMGGFEGPYTFCFLRPPDEPHPCPDVGMRRQEVIFGGTLPDAERTRVLVVPPTHGDLGNPLGPTVLDYLDATLSGIDEWVRVLGDFADDHPEYDYLRQVGVEVALFDGTQPWEGYDIVITFVESGGTAFRGVASSCLSTFGTGPRCIALSLYSVAPRSGQTLPDYPEYNDLEAVVKHEFAHVWGLGHTLTWTEAHGPDLMNSPAPFVYGDGSPVGDGGERTGKKCVSSLNLHVTALLFQHLDGKPKVSGGAYHLPEHIPYSWYC